MTASTDTPSYDGYVLDYQLRNHDLADRHRRVEVYATPAEVEQFADDGYLVRERMFQGAQLERLRAALDEVVRTEHDSGGSAMRVNTSGTFGGLFLRHLMDKHAAFLELLAFQPILSVVRAMLGPQVQVRGASARIAYPDESNQETHWHFHQRLIPDPLPPFFSRPHTIDALIYLDDADDVNGPLCVMPGSHQWTDRDLPAGDYDDMAGQRVLRLPAGSCVLAHGALWHRAMPTRPDGTVRRLLLWGYGPTWLKPSIFGQRPANPLSDTLLADADPETRELLGVTGWM